MTEISRIAIDTSKSVLTLHGTDADGRAVLEACGGSHHWGRVLAGLGHTVRLIRPQYVKPFVKRGKNDRNDSEAISEAASRPEMREVAVKSADQQAKAMLLSVRELLVRQRTQLVNALRGHAAEFGHVGRLGRAGMAKLMVDVAEDAEEPTPAKDALALRGAEIGRLDARLAEVDARLVVQHKQTPTSKMLAEVPGIGPIGALSLLLRVDFSQFKSGRHFASWLGLTPREHSTGGKTRLGGISRAGDERLRQLLVLGATAVIRRAKPGRASPWLIALLARRPRKLALVALANKMARIVWAMMTSGEAYRQPATA